MFLVWSDCSNVTQHQPGLPAHHEGPGAAPVVPLQVLQVAEEQCVHCRAVHGEQDTEQIITVNNWDT